MRIILIIVFENAHRLHIKKRVVVVLTIPVLLEQSTPAWWCRNHVPLETKNAGQSLVFADLKGDIVASHHCVLNIFLIFSLAYFCIEVHSSNINDLPVLLFLHFF